MRETYTTPTDALRGMARYLLASDEVPSRNGTTREQLMNRITVKYPLERVITAAKRKASLPAQIAESAWILAGRNDIEWLSNYLPRAAEFSDDGKVWRGGYGPRLRRWGEVDRGIQHLGRSGVDQLAHVVRLLKSDPETRRAVISLYDPAVDTAPGKDIPCNDLLHFIARGESLHLHVVTRSNDLIWGWSGVNQFEWSVLLEVVARLTGFEMGAITYSITSLHLYERHYKKAEAIASSPTANIGVTPPRFDLDNIGQLDGELIKFFEIENTLRTTPDHDHTAVIEGSVKDPMLRSWLMVLAYWWSGRETYLAELEDTALPWGARNSPGRPLPPAPQLRTEIARCMADLHQRKDKAYGDSWKKRGEFVSIQANVARKVDRLGASDGDENALDTLMDLTIYLIKYQRWMRQDGTDQRTEDEVVRSALSLLETTEYQAYTIGQARVLFEEILATPDIQIRRVLVSRLLWAAWNLTLDEWESTQKRNAEMKRALWGGAEPTSNYVNQDR